MRRIRLATTEEILINRIASLKKQSGDASILLCKGEELLTVERALMEYRENHKGKEAEGCIS